MVKIYEIVCLMTELRTQTVAQKPNVHTRAFPLYCADEWNIIFIPLNKNSDVVVFTRCMREHVLRRASSSLTRLEVVALPIFFAENTSSPETPRRKTLRSDLSNLCCDFILLILLEECRWRGLCGS